MVEKVTVVRVPAFPVICNNAPDEPVKRFRSLKKALLFAQEQNRTMLNSAEHLIATPHTGCKGCIFNGKALQLAAFPICTKPTTVPNCLGIHREDNTSVIYSIKYFYLVKTWH